MKIILLILSFFVFNISNAQQRYKEALESTLKAEELINEGKIEDGIFLIKKVEKYRLNAGCADAIYAINNGIESAYTTLYIKKEKYWEGVTHLDSTKYYIRSYLDFKLIQRYKSRLFNRIYLKGELKSEILELLKKGTILSYKISEDKYVLLLKIKTKDIPSLDLYFETNESKLNTKKQVIDFALANITNQELYKYLNSPKP